MSNVEKVRRNVTRNVTGKVENGKVTLYHNKAPIGSVDLYTDQISMYNGYELEEDRVYAISEHAYQDQYAHNCDMGWCQ